MIDKGWSFEARGNISVPKTFEVHLINYTALKSEGVVSMQVARTQRGFERFSHLVSTTSRYYPLSAGDELIALEEVRALVHQTPPIGSVVAFAGDAASVPAGWRLCNGDLIKKGEAPYDTIAAILGTTYGGTIGESVKLPDFRGMFLRGVGNRAAELGKKQDCATALPQKPFVTDEIDLTPKWDRGCSRLVRYDKNKDVTIKGGCTDSTSFTPEPNLLESGELAIPKHQHKVERGGDVETRPDNYAVYWIIRVE